MPAAIFSLSRTFETRPGRVDIAAAVTYLGNDVSLATDSTVFGQVDVQYNYDANSNVVSTVVEVVTVQSVQYFDSLFAYEIARLTIPPDGWPSVGTTFTSFGWYSARSTLSHETLDLATDSFGDVAGLYSRHTYDGYLTVPAYAMERQTWIAAVPVLAPSTVVRMEVTDFRLTLPSSLEDATTFFGETRTLLIEDQSSWNAGEQPGAVEIDGTASTESWTVLGPSNSTDDTFRFGSGDDTFVGAFGWNDNDLYDGGAGYDTLTFGSSWRSADFTDLGNGKYAFQFLSSTIVAQNIERVLGLHYTHPELFTWENGRPDAWLPAIGRTLTFTSPYLEMARLAQDAYNEPIPTAGMLDMFGIVAAELAIDRAWVPLHKLALGMRETATARFSNGTFTNGEAAASIKIGYQEGVGGVLSIAFRGTDNPPNDWVVGGYEKFRPLIDALKEFFALYGSSFQRIYVTGHSWGGYIAQQFMAEFGDNAKMIGATFGSYQGANGADASDSRILNFVHDEDSVTWLAPDDPGAEVFLTINDLRYWNDDGGGFFEHNMPLYIKSVLGLSNLGAAGAPWMQSMVQDPSQKYHIGVGTTRSDQFGGDAASDENELLYGLDGDDLILGFRGVDTLDGGAGNDTLLGGRGDDVLFGRSGVDRLWGETGSDVLVGGADKDVFIYRAKAESQKGFTRGVDLIVDFDDAGNDVIDLSALRGPKLTYLGTKKFFAPGQVRIQDVKGPDVIVEVNLSGKSGAEMHIRLLDTSLSSMTKGDFIL